MEDCCTSQIQTVGNISQRSKHTLAKQSGFSTGRVINLFMGNSPSGGILDWFSKISPGRNPPGFTEGFVYKREREEHGNGRGCGPTQNRTPRNSKSSPQGTDLWLTWYLVEKKHFSFSCSILGKLEASFQDSLNKFWLIQVLKYKTAIYEKGDRLHVLMQNALQDKMFNEKRKMQNSVQNICGKTVKSHLKYMLVYKCLCVGVI